MNTPQLKKNCKWAFLYFLVYIMVHLCFITRQGLHIDEVTDFAGENSGIYIAAGRWGLYGYRLIMGQGIYPVTAGLIAGIFISVAIVIQTHLFKLQTDFAKLAYGFLYMACNQWATQLIYSHQSDAVALALLFCTISVYQICQKNTFILPLILFTLAISVYQTCAIYFLVIWAGTIIANRQFSCKAIIRFAGISILAIIIYFSIAHIFKESSLVTLENKNTFTKYQSGLTQWGNFIHLSPVTQILFLLHYCKISFIEAFGFGNQSSILQPTAIIPAIYLATCLFIHNKGINKLAYPVIVLSVWVLPFFMNFLWTGYAPNRTLLAEPVALSFLWASSINRFKPSPRIIAAFGIIIVFFILKASYKNSAEARNHDLNYQQMVTELNKIHLYGKLLAQQEQMCNAKIILLSDFNKSRTEKEMKIPHRDFISSHIDIQGLHRYTNHLNLHDLIPGDKEQFKKHKDTFHKMTCWPEPGSMIVNKGDIIVRMHP